MGRGFKIGAAAGLQANNLRCRLQPETHGAEQQLSLFEDQSSGNGPKDLSLEVDGRADAVPEPPKPHTDASQPSKSVIQAVGLALNAWGFGIWEFGGLNHKPEDPKTLNPKTLRP